MVLVDTALLFLVLALRVMLFYVEVFEVFHEVADELPFELRMIYSVD